MALCPGQALGPDPYNLWPLIWVHTLSGPCPGPYILWPLILGHNVPDFDYEQMVVDEGYRYSALIISFCTM